MTSSHPQSSTHRTSGAARLTSVLPERFRGVSTPTPGTSAVPDAFRSTSTPQGTMKVERGAKPPTSEAES